MTWPPIQKLGIDLVIKSTISELVTHVKREFSDLYTLHYVREVIEMAIRLKCADARVAWLSSYERDAMAHYVALEPAALLHELTTINREIDRLNLDTWIDVGPLVLDERTDEGS